MQNEAIQMMVMGLCIDFFYVVIPCKATSSFGRKLASVTFI